MTCPSPCVMYPIDTELLISCLHKPASQWIGIYECLLCMRLIGGGQRGHYKRFFNYMLPTRGSLYFFSVHSVQFSHSVMSDSFQPHESQHARPPCPSPTPRVYPDSRPTSQWCHPAISSSVVPFSSCPQSSQHQSLFQSVNSSNEVAKVLEFQL